jgi:thymidylate synthase
MGNNTFKSLTKLLDNRIHYVISHNTESKSDNDQVIYFDTLSEALIQANKNNAKISVIGGVQLIYDTLNIAHTIYTKITMYHSIVPLSVESDPDNVYFDFTKVPHHFILSSKNLGEFFGGCNIHTYTYTHPEYEYLNLIQDILCDGKLTQNRTGVNTITKVGCTLRIPLASNVLPVLTTKKVNYNHIVTELLWFLNGDTNSKTLSTQGVKIWDDNTTREFHANRINKLVTTYGSERVKDDIKIIEQYNEGDAGPIYHHQWRHWGAEYVNCDTIYTTGIDQIKRVIEQINIVKNDPLSPEGRRLIVSAWNVSDLDKMVLNPCHTLFQFHVLDGTLSCTLYQRSGDVGLGIPYNITSYALLTHIIATIAGLVPKELVIFIANAHIYTDHVTQLTMQQTREPMVWPTLLINKIQDIDNLTENDITVLNYKSHSHIKMKMAV